MHVAARNAAPTLMPADMTSTPLPKVSNDSKVILGDVVRYLLMNSPNTPCYLIANIYDEIVPSDQRFQLALEVVLPCLTSGPNYLVRIAAVYVLYVLYAPHPIDLNPFKSALLEQFITQQSRLASMPHASGNSGNNQFVLVLWKVLHGEGKGLQNQSPQQLADQVLSDNERAQCLTSPEQVTETDDPPPNSQDFTSSDVEEQSTVPTADSWNTIASSTSGDVLPTTQEEHEEALSRAVTLLLTARSRVLTLSEQRALKPYLAMLASPLPVLKSTDLLALIAHNPTIAHLFIAQLLKAEVLQWEDYFTVLCQLRPSLSSFDLMGRLLSDKTEVEETRGSKIIIADLIRRETLHGFIHSCVTWIERKESESGNEANERFEDSLEKATINLCRFYSTLISVGLVDPLDDTENVEMLHFTLRYSQLEEANNLYKSLANIGLA